MSGILDIVTDIQFPANAIGVSRGHSPLTGISANGEAKKMNETAIAHCKGILVAGQLNDDCFGWPLQHYVGAVAANMIGQLEYAESLGRPPLHIVQVICIHSYFDERRGNDGGRLASVGLPVGRCQRTNTRSRTPTHVPKEMNTTGLMASDVQAQ